MPELSPNLVDIKYLENDKLAITKGSLSSASVTIVDGINFTNVINYINMYNIKTFPIVLDQ